MSVLERSTNAISRRVMVNEDDHVDGLGVLFEHVRDSVGARVGPAAEAWPRPSPLLKLKRSVVSPAP